MILSLHMYYEHRHTESLAGFTHKLNEKPTEQCSVSVSFVLGYVFDKKDQTRPKFLGKHEKPTC